jgi:hypothetical protein
VASSPTVPPDRILDDAAKTLRQRGTDYDGKGYQGGERSMAQTVELFKAFTGIEISELDGWRFLLCLKLARSTTGKPKLDTYVDLAGYAALAGECHLATRLDPPSPGDIAAIVSKVSNAP